MPQRKAIAVLKAAPERIEILLKACSEKDASLVRRGQRESIRSVVSRMGTRDRHDFLERARRLCAGGGDVPDPLPDAADPADAEALGGCELAELATRFRHVRAQSIDFLESVPATGWQRISALVAEWVDHDAAALETLKAMCSDLNRS